ncbi:hypothetical protein EHJ02_15085 [Cronobacter sakazakii]|nr:hypothetical protein [Cronobacter sakazakii]
MATVSQRTRALPSSDAQDDKTVIFASGVFARAGGRMSAHHLRRNDDEPFSNACRRSPFRPAGPRACRAGEFTERACTERTDR